MPGKLLALMDLAGMGGTCPLNAGRATGCLKRFDLARKSDVDATTLTVLLLLNGRLACIQCR